MPWGDEAGHREISTPKRLPYWRGKKLLYKRFFSLPLILTIALGLVLVFLSWSWWFLGLIAFVVAQWGGSIIRYRRVVNSPMFYLWLVKQEILGEE